MTKTEEDLRRELEAIPNFLEMTPEESIVLKTLSYYCNCDRICNLLLYIVHHSTY